MKQFWVSSYDKFSTLLHLGGNEDKMLIKGESPIQAANAFLNGNKDNRKAKRSSDNDVQLCLSEICFQNGTMFLTGKKTWYKLIT